MHQIIIVVIRVFIEMGLSGYSPLHRKRQLELINIQYNYWNSGVFKRNVCMCTHSEYIVLWFLKEIREKRISNNDIKVYWVFEDGMVSDIRIDSDGDFIDRFPGGFYEERANLLFY